LKRHALLRGLHEVLQPRTYFEIGVREGASLVLSRARSVGVDPAYSIVTQLHCDVQLVRTTSDEFFARDAPFAHFDEPLIDLAFIDGMHLSEFALRDFINTEKFCHPGSVVVIDDVLPRNVDQARRERKRNERGGGWAGDVYKMIETLHQVRPELVVLELDTEPTGTVVVLNPDPADRRLDEAYDRLVPEYVVPDPQAVPAWALSRTRTISGQELLSSPVWPEIRALRGRSAAEAATAAGEAYRRAGLATPKGV
jgi:hypothetical protein